MSERGGLIKAAGLIAAMTVISKILGFIREASLAAVFGATRATDAYLVGQTIPMLVFAAVGAALGTTFIPVYAQVRRERGREGAFAMADSVVNATMLASLAVIAAGELLAAPLTRLVAPGFRGQAYALTVSLTRIMFPMVMFQSLSGLLSAMLQTEGNFFVPAVVSLWFNVLVISSIVGLGPRYGIGAVAVGTVVALMAQVVAQAPALARLGYQWRPRLDLRDPGLARVLKLSAPVLVGSSVSQAGLLVDRMLASGLAAGSVAALNYASKLMLLVPSILGTAIVTVMYPTLAKLSAEGNWARYSSAFTQSVKIINFLMLPVAVGMVVLRVPLVRLAFERGAFDTRATEATSWALLFFSLSVAAFSLRDMVSRAFYAFQDTLAPMMIGAVAVLINIALNLALVGPLRHGGLALATSLAGLFNAVALLWVLRGRIRKVSGGLAPGIGGRAILDSLWRVVVASLLMAAAVWAVHEQLRARLPGQGVAAQAIRLFSAVGAGVVVYGVLVLLLRVPEARLTLETGRAVARKGWEKAMKALGRVKKA
ncbi:MAG: murein biosynthesis integral membrane protein MurJ [Bacillota bacterium]|nr:murein biosynthesis integral membrane protein MurJ [Bacillota bacterium]